jgi:hypothetical protein
VNARRTVEEADLLAGEQSAKVARRIFDDARKSGFLLQAAKYCTRVEGGSVPTYWLRPRSEEVPGVFPPASKYTIADNLTYRLCMKYGVTLNSVWNQLHYLVGLHLKHELGEAQELVTGKYADKVAQELYRQATGLAVWKYLKWNELSKKVDWNAPHAGMSNPDDTGACLVWAESIELADFVRAAVEVVCENNNVPLDSEVAAKLKKLLRKYARERLKSVRHVTESQELVTGE